MRAQESMKWIIVTAFMDSHEGLGLVLTAGDTLETHIN